MESSSERVRTVCAWFDSAQKIVERAVLFLVFFALAVLAVWHFLLFVAAEIHPAQAAPSASSGYSLPADDRGASTLRMSASL